MNNREKVIRVVLPIAAVVVILVQFLYQVLWAPNLFEGSQIVTVSKGMTFRQVFDSLTAKGVIRNGFMFRTAAWLLGATKEIEVGRYIFTSGASNKRILNDFTSGRGTLIPVAIPEGLRITSTARVLRRELGIDSARFAQLANDFMFIESLGIKAQSLEGYLLPDTYLFNWQPDEEAIIRRMVEEFQKFFVDSLSKRAAERKMSVYQVLTFASIVEGETSLDEERPIIAGVYYNRLRIRMHLQADPTIQYILPGGPRRLNHDDLRIPSPYNTYRRYGLPPGPINSPGRASILATLYPAKHNFLFFVANGKGGHVFTRTYSEHLRAVSKYRRILRAMARQGRW